MPRRGTRSESVRRGDTLAALRTAFDLLVSVQNGAEHTVHSLAAELGLSAKQTGRYLDVLEEFGVGFAADAEGRRASPLRITTAKRASPFNTIFLTREELLLLYAQLAGLHHAGDAPTRTQLFEKVRQTMGVDPIDTAQLAGAISTFEKAYKSYEGKQAVVADLLAALYAGQTCQVTYQTPEGEGPRTYRIEPYELIEHDGGLYCYCRVPRHDRVILLAAERIQTLRRDGESFRRAKSVEQEISKKKERAFRILDDEQPLEVELRFSSKIAFYVAERIWHPTQKLTWNNDGTLTMTFTASGRVEIERWIRGWGEEAEAVRVSEAQ